jgi:hypothetical protein
VISFPQNAFLARASSSAIQILVALIFLLVSSTAVARIGLATLSDEELSSVTGQVGSLFLSDHIGPNELAGAPANGAANFDFYRMGMDVKLSMESSGLTVCLS